MSREADLHPVNQTWEIFPVGWWQFHFEIAHFDLIICIMISKMLLYKLHGKPLGQLNTTFRRPLIIFRHCLCSFLRCFLVFQMKKKMVEIRVCCNSCNGSNDLTNLSKKMNWKKNFTIWFTEECYHNNETLDVYVRRMSNWHHWAHWNTKSESCLTGYKTELVRWNIPIALWHIKNLPNLGLF